MIDYKLYGDDSDAGSVCCSLASLDTIENSEIPSDLQSASSSEYMSNCGNEGWCDLDTDDEGAVEQCGHGGWCDYDTDDEGAIKAAEKLAAAMTSPVSDRWCDVDTDDEDAAETENMVAEAMTSPVAGQQGDTGKQGGEGQECWPTFYFTPLSSAQQVLALQAQASQLRAQARLAEDVAQLARKACSRTAGQHSKRSRKRAERRLQQMQEQWPQHCDQSWPLVCATVSLPVSGPASATPCVPPGKF
jgi:hypothetical protein